MDKSELTKFVRQQIQAGYNQLKIAIDAARKFGIYAENDAPCEGRQKSINHFNTFK
jgi:hypothetical protein